MQKSMIASSHVLRCLFFTEIANKKRKFVDILGQSLSQTRLCHPIYLEPTSRLLGSQGSNFNSHTRKMRVKKAISEVEFSLLTFLAEENLGPLYMVLTLDINLLSSFLKCPSLTANIFIFIHRKTLSSQCANANDKLRSMVGSQPIICFLISDCSKYSQV